jgi:hypothetical protein
MDAAIAGGSSTIGVAHVVLQSTVPLHLSQVPAHSGFPIAASIDPRLCSSADPPHRQFGGGTSASYLRCGATFSRCPVRGPDDVAVFDAAVQRTPSPGPDPTAGEGNNGKRVSRRSLGAPGLPPEPANHTTLVPEHKYLPRNKLELEGTCCVAP